MPKKEKRKRRSLDDLLEIPKEVYTQEPKLTIIGFNEMLMKIIKGF